jgi:hypothetical protein
MKKILWTNCNILITALIVSTILLCAFRQGQAQGDVNPAFLFKANLCAKCNSSAGTIDQIQAARLEITGKITAVSNVQITVQNEQETLNLGITKNTIKNREVFKVDDMVTVTYFVADILIAENIRVH